MLSLLALPSASSSTTEQSTSAPVRGRQLASVLRQLPYKSRVARTRLGDGCRHVFLDVGSNHGLHVRYLMEGSRVFQGSPYLGWKIFDEYFGPDFVDDKSICAFAFEPHPANRPRLNNLAMRLRGQGRRFEVFHVAASDETGSILFKHRTDDNGFGASDFGASADPGKERNRTFFNVKVPTTDLADFIGREIVGRKIPPAPPEARMPAIVMKLDCEGAELVVLERMRSLCVLCELSMITLEYHPDRLYPEKGVENPNSYLAHPEVFDLLHNGTHGDYGYHTKDLQKVMQERRQHRKSLKIVTAPLKGEQACKASRGKTASITSGLSGHSNCHAGARTKGPQFMLKDDEQFNLTPDIPGAKWQGAAGVTGPNAPLSKIPAGAAETLRKNAMEVGYTPTPGDAEAEPA